MTATFNNHNDTWRTEKVRDIIHMGGSAIHIRKGNRGTSAAPPIKNTRLYLFGYLRFSAYFPTSWIYVGCVFAKIVLQSHLNLENCMTVRTGYAPSEVTAVTAKARAYQREQNARGRESRAGATFGKSGKIECKNQSK